MPKDRRRGILDRKISKLAGAKKLHGENLRRVMKREDMLRKSKPTTTTTVTRKRPTTTTTMKPKRTPTKQDKILLSQGFTRKELGLD
jgi:hypothetical protein